ncbi:MAG TPA: type II secretion system F family protein [Thermodesulfobacteriota bacterium]|nr:type II secretion system F family protein [Thermodesulfobacteriota bacterium]
MPLFLWEGKDRTGSVKKGEYEAPNEATVQVYLRGIRITPTRVREKSKSVFTNKLGGARQQKIKVKDVVVFTRQFSTMIDAGLPLIQGLEILAGQQVNKSFKRVLTDIKETVEGGSTLADSLKKHPRVFDELYVNLVAAGEVGGILDIILQRLAVHMEKIAALKRKIKGAMLYPIIVLTVAVGVVAVLLIFVIPIFAKMFSEFGKELPAFTQMVIDFSHWLTRAIIPILFFLGLFSFLFVKFYKTPKGKLLVDSFILKSPIIGDVVRKVAIARFTRTLGTMISSGVPILDGLDIVSRTAGNKVVQNAIDATRKSISEGKSFAEPLNTTGVFPPMVIQMIAVGESTGALDSMLGKIADFYDEEVDAAVEALTTMVEPLLILFLGATVGTLVIAMYLPIFTMASAIE